MKPPKQRPGLTENALPLSTTRRGFLGGAVALGAVGCARDPIEAAPLPPLPHDSVAPGAVPRRPLGSTGAQVSVLGLGGSHLGQVDTLDEAKRIVAEAMDAGINFFDNAWEYNDGKSEDWLGKALVGRREHAFLMTKVCTHGRDHLVAQQQLEESLRRLGTDYLDLWQVHECVYDNDPERHFVKDGVIRALEDAKKAGKVRFVGFTGHKHPRIHQKMLGQGFAFDTVQMPLNVFDANFRSFEREIVPIAVQRKLGVIGMKSLGGTGQAILEGVVTIEEALRYAMSVPGVSVTVSGIDSLAILRQNLAIAREFKALTASEMQALRERTADDAGDGHFELYKTSTRFDAKVGREQHGYPPQDELPL